MCCIVNYEYTRAYVIRHPLLWSTTETTAYGVKSTRDFCLQTTRKRRKEKQMMFSLKVTNLFKKMKWFCSSCHGVCVCVLFESNGNCTWSSNVRVSTNLNIYTQHFSFSQSLGSVSWHMHTIDRDSILVHFILLLLKYKVCYGITTWLLTLMTTMKVPHATLQCTQTHSNGLIIFLLFFSVHYLLSVLIAHLWSLRAICFNRIAPWQHSRIHWLYVWYTSAYLDMMK